NSSREQTQHKHFGESVTAVNRNLGRMSRDFETILPVAMDEAAKKSILRHFPYGLYAVTVAHDGEDHGMTANWLTQAAFEPPMVVVGEIVAAGIEHDGEPLTLQEAGFKYSG